MGELDELTVQVTDVPCVHDAASHCILVRGERDLDVTEHEEVPHAIAH